MSRRQPFTLEQIAYHRNGITGCGFHVVTFRDHNNGDHFGTPMLAIVFDSEYADDGCLTAVLNREKAAAGDIASMSNAWRGDYFDSWLREQIKTYQERP